MSKRRLLYICRDKDRQIARKRQSDTWQISQANLQTVGQADRQIDRQEEAGRKQDQYILRTEGQMYREYFGIEMDMIIHMYIHMEKRLIDVRQIDKYIYRQIHSLCIDYQSIVVDYTILPPCICSLMQSIDNCSSHSLFIYREIYKTCFISENVIYNFWKSPNRGIWKIEKIVFF